jgi:hypothetical protein
MTFTYPIEKWLSRPDPSVIEGTEEAIRLREQFVSEGKIITIEEQSNPETHTIKRVTVYRSKADCDEFTSIPVIADYFQRRLQFYTGHGIKKDTQFMEI